MQTIERRASATQAMRVSRSERVADTLRAMSHEELAERIRVSQSLSPAEVVAKQRAERRARAEAAAARLKSA